MTDKIVTVDCTLRDGGYYNSWDFPPEIVQRYIDAMAAAKIDFVEIGFRALPQKKFFGAHAFTTENYLAQFSIPADLKLGVMLNAGDILNAPVSAAELVDALFCDAAQSAVSLVRIACHFHEYKDVLPTVERLSDKGYLVGLNLMQIASRSDRELKEFADDVRLAPIVALYIADSTGSLQPARTTQIVRHLAENSLAQIGVHMHDNMGLALQNSLAAMQAGATFIDSTVTGMGRGPGNAQTEYMIAEDAVCGGKTPNPVPLMRLIDDYFGPMKNELGWGENYFYYLAGKYQIHPTYIHEMLDDPRYESEDIITAIDHLKDNGTKYSREILNDALNFVPVTSDGGWCPKHDIEGRKVLIVASGPSVQRYSNAIETFIRTQQPYVIALNTEQSIGNELIDLRVACHAKRILSDLGTYERLPHPFVLPLASVEKSVNSQFNDEKFRDFGVRINEEKFDFDVSSATLPAPLSLAYALAIANSGAAKSIFIAGVDGYASGDARNYEIENTFSCYFHNENSVGIASITPTLFNVPISSVFSY